MAAATLRTLGVAFRKTARHDPLVLPRLKIRPRCRSPHGRSVNTPVMERRANEDKLAYRIEEAAALLSLSRSLMYELINAGKIRTIKIGRARRITKRQLDEFLAELQ